MKSRVHSQTENEDEWMEIFWIIVAVLIVFGIVVNLRELIRYLRIRSM